MMTYVLIVKLLIILCEVDILNSNQKLIPLIAALHAGPTLNFYVVYLLRRLLTITYADKDRARRLALSIAFFKLIPLPLFYSTVQNN